MPRTDTAALIAALEQAVPGVRIESAATIDLQATVYVAAADLPAVARALADTPPLAFSLLVELTAVDFWPREPRFELVYIVVSVINRLRLRISLKELQMIYKSRANNRISTNTNTGGLPNARFSQKCHNLIGKSTRA